MLLHAVLDEFYQFLSRRERLSRHEVVKFLRQKPIDASVAQYVIGIADLGVPVTADAFFMHSVIMAAASIEDVTPVLFLQLMYGSHGRIGRVIETMLAPADHAERSRILQTMYHAITSASNVQCDPVTKTWQYVVAEGMLRLPCCRRRELVSRVLKVVSYVQARFKVCLNINSMRTVHNIMRDRDALHGRDADYDFPFALVYPDEMVHDIIRYWVYEDADDH